MQEEVGYFSQWVNPFVIFPVLQWGGLLGIGSWRIVLDRSFGGEVRVCELQVLRLRPIEGTGEGMEFKNVENPLNRIQIVFDDVAPFMEIGEPTQHPFVGDHQIEFLISKLCTINEGQHVGANEFRPFGVPHLGGQSGCCFDGSRGVVHPNHCLRTQPQEGQGVLTEMALEMQHPLALHQ